MRNSNPRQTIPRGWHSRGYLPHFDPGPIPQAVTFRLSNSLPRHLDGSAGPSLPAEARHNAAKRRLFHAELDAGRGERWLEEERIAQLVEGALLHFDEERYALHAWVLMPNHVHVVVTPASGWSLGGILKSWKAWTGARANKLLHRGGPFWVPDCHDRFIRNEQHLENAIAYAENNPVMAGLCRQAADWPFGSARKAPAAKARTFDRQAAARPH